MVKNPDKDIINNPALEDLEETESSLNQGTKKENVFQELTNSVETMLNAEKNDNTIISYDNEVGLIGIDVIQAHMKEFFGFEYPSLTALSISKKSLAVSVHGKRSEQKVEIFKSLQPNIITGDIPIQSRLLGMNRR
jgi:hypothetical protein